MSTVSESPSLAERVAEAIDSEEFELPALPDLAIRLRNMLAGDDADAGKVVELLKTDAAVAASIFRAANSALYGGLQPITNLQQAVVRLGLRRVETIVTTMHLKGQFASKDPANRELFQALWNHSIASATVCQWLARREDLAEEEAFLAGLLHGIGRLLVLKAVDVVREAGGTEFTITPEVLAEMMDAFHADLGERVLLEWGLPERICASVRAVDKPTDELEDRLLIGIQVADLITRKLGFHPHPDPDLALLDEPAAEEFNLGDLEAASLMVDLEDQIAAVHKMCDEVA